MPVNLEQEEAREEAQRSRAIIRAIRLRAIEKVLMNMRRDKDALGVATVRQMVEDLWR